MAGGGPFELAMVLFLLIGLNFLLGRVKDFSCEMQALWHDNLAVRHSLGLAGVFFVLVVFTRAAGTPLLSANQAVLLSATLYAMFMVLARCDHRFFLACIAVVVVLFYLQAWRTYAQRRLGGERPLLPSLASLLHGAAPSSAENAAVDDKQRLQATMDIVLKAQIALVCVFFVLAAAGCVVYIGQHSVEYNRTWSWRRFWLGVHECRGNNSPGAANTSNMLGHARDGLRRIAGRQPMRRR